MFVEQCGRGRVEIDLLGHHQALRIDALVHQGRENPVVVDALVQRVLIDNRDAVLDLADEVGIVHLHHRKRAGARARSLEFGCRSGRFLDASRAIPGPERPPGGFVA